MSISKVRSMFEKKGCQVLLGIVGVLTIIGLMNTGTCTLGQPGPGSVANATLVAEIAGKPILATNIEDFVERDRQGRPDVGSPNFEFFITANAIDQAVNQSATVVLAEQRGLKADAATLQRVLDEQFAQLAESEKLQLVQEKKLKAGATEKEFIEAFKKKYNGKTPEEIKADRTAVLQAELKDPVKGPPLRDSVLSVLLVESYEKSSNATMEELKKSFDNFNLQRIAFDDAKMTPEQKKAEAEKALAEIRGGLKFSEAIKKYNKGRPSEPLPYGRELLSQQEQLKVLLELKPGQTSDILDQGGTPVIFHLVSTTANLPTDFEKTKDQRLKQFRAQLATQALQKDVEALKSGKLVWKDPAVKYAYDVFKVQNEGFRLGLEGMQKRLEELVGEAATITPTTGLGDKLLTLAKFSAFESYFQGLAPEKQKEAREERSTMLREVLDRGESNEVRLQLYDNLLASEDYESAAEVLVEAAKYHSGIDEASVRMTGEIRLRADKAEKDKKIDPELIKEVRKELARWAQERVDANKAESETTKSNPDVDKELEQLNDPEAEKKAAQTTGGGKQ